MFRWFYYVVFHSALCMKINDHLDQYVFAFGGLFFMVREYCYNTLRQQSVHVCVCD